MYEFIREENRKKYLNFECPIRRTHSDTGNYLSDGKDKPSWKVVATRHLDKGETICYVCGITYRERGESIIIPEEQQYEPVDGCVHNKEYGTPFTFRLYKNKSIDPTNISRWITHSCNPNCNYKRDCKNTIIRIYANTEIEAGEEITIDYCWSCSDDEKPTMVCKCGSENCHGHIDYHRISRSQHASKAKDVDSKPVAEAEEGSTYEVRLEKLERSKKLRRAVLERDQYTCQICETNMADVYGTAKGIIQVHHKKPLKDHRGESQTTIIKDLVALCPNCHAALHTCYDDPNDEAIKDLRKQYRKCQHRKTK